MNRNQFKNRYKKKFIKTQLEIQLSNSIKHLFHANTICICFADL